MKAAQIKTVVSELVDRIEWTDLRRGKMHIRQGANVYLIDVAGLPDAAHIARMVADAPRYALNLIHVAGSQYAV
ncbi:hypothetical protein [Cupriavidus pampae]|jgi:hypothetical protein|uniref:Uncharacterized protein n=1 Tax=Cupriavidus pampae TaxID=659251 RepID=A0ABM8XV76_9BURK|nr:hypothetical protein [Cupriavidus pampae]CAG9184106.1 hypothetical protein LMG32289_05511 [Cupriavidus pampae]